MSEAEPSGPSAEEEKRPFQFSLRTMFVVTFIWAVFCTIGATFGLHVAFFVAASCSFLIGFIVIFYSGNKAGNGMIFLGIVLVGLSLASLPTYRGHEVARRPSCVNKLKQLVLAPINYEDDHGRLPPAYIADEFGKPMHSWRVLLLPYFDRNDIYDKYNFDEPWDGPNNRKLHHIVMPEFCCPKGNPAAKKTDTCYVAVVGPNTVFPGEEPVNLDDIPDGASKTIMFVEVSNSGIHWMEPRDLNIEEMALTINPPSGKGISSNHQNYANVVFANGSVRTFSENQLTPQQLQALLTRNGGEEVDLESLE